MSSQPVAVARQISRADTSDYSFLEALELELASEKSLSLLSNGELGLPPPSSDVKPTPRYPTVAREKTPIMETTRQLKPAASTVSLVKFSKAQTACLQLCLKTTALSDRISVRVLEYLTTVKQLPAGFEALAHDFLDTCHILFSIEAGLEECNQHVQNFPPEMITELDHKFRATQANFQLFYQMLAKFLEHEDKTVSRMRRGWGKIFGDTGHDIKKMTSTLARTRDDLRMSALVFQWSLGAEKIEKELGIGYLGLAAALDRMDEKSGKPKAKPTVVTAEPPLQNAFAAMSVRSEPQLNVLTPIQTQQSVQTQQPHAPPNQPLPPLPWPGRSSSAQHDAATIERASGSIARVQTDSIMSQNTATSPRTLGSDLSQYNTVIKPRTPLSSGSSDRHYSDISNAYDRHHHHHHDDTHSHSDTHTIDGSLLKEVDGIQLSPSQPVRLKADPESMPRWNARNNVGMVNTGSMKISLISAIREKNHTTIERLLDSGCPANTGLDMHALKEAIAVHDAEAVRMLLLYGADPNEPDRDGITPLRAAVEKSFLAGATALLKYGADPNLVAGTDLESPLAAAVMHGMVGFAHLFLVYNGDANHLTASGNTLLISAINKRTSVKFIELLLSYGANPNAKSKEGKTALFEAISCGRADLVSTLLSHGADPNLPGPKHMLWPATYQPACLQILLTHGADPKKCPGIMELATSLNNIESVRTLLNAKVDPNARKDGVYTPLCTSIRDDRAEIFTLLLSHGADPNTMASEYPAWKCVTHNRVHFLPALVAAGADLHSPKGIVEMAVSCNNLEALNWLLDNGADPNEKNAKGMTALTTAIREDRLEMIELLLLRGADANVRGQDWPICMAVAHPPVLKRLLSVLPEPRAYKGVMEMAVHANKLESVKLLLAAGVSVEDRNGGVFSPLTTAIREDRKDIVSFLLREGGADVNAPGEHLPIVKALRRYNGEDTEIIEMLLNAGADPNRMYRGWNAVFQAVENGDAEMLKLIAERSGVNLEVKDEMGRTVSDMAAGRGWTEAVAILHDNMSL
ncbi:ankyrin repeat domain containing protein [Rutstroemia sp. NJR-2017a BBW]|nr:ankyrin repeat domain containing protein [Rutstroemia sp. NJR-2017a BBW]